MNSRERGIMRIEIVSRINRLVDQTTATRCCLDVAIENMFLSRCKVRCVSRFFFEKRQFEMYVSRGAEGSNWSIKWQTYFEPPPR